MPIFFYQGRLTPGTWTRLAAESADVSEYLRPSIERFGGRVMACFVLSSKWGGEPAGFLEFPDLTTALAWSTHLVTEGVATKAKITPALTAAESVDLVKKLATAGGAGW